MNRRVVLLGRDVLDGVLFSCFCAVRSVKSAVS